MSAASGSTGAVLVALALAAVTFAPGAGRLAWRAGWRPTLRTVLAWVGLNASWWWPFLTAAPSDADTAALDDAQTRLAGFADAAEPSVKPALDRLVLTGGLVRIQAATKMLREEVVELGEGLVRRVLRAGARLERFR